MEIKTKSLCIAQVEFYIRTPQQTPEQEQSLNIIRICGSCTTINAGIEDLESFHRGVENQLREARPDIEWKVERSPCLKVCPIGKMTMTVTMPELSLQDRLTLAREATLDAVVKEALSHLVPMTKK